MSSKALGSPGRLFFNSLLARASDLVPNTSEVRNRRMIGLVAISGAMAVGSADGRLGVAASGGSSIRRLRFDPQFVPPFAHVAAGGASQSFPGTSTLSDVIVLGTGSLFCDGFEL